jgi:rfaE bifunctional protein kinase chain/domain
MGAEVMPLSVIGNDDGGSILLDLFRSFGIDSSLIIRDESRKTVNKCRVIGGGRDLRSQQILRIDSQNSEQISKDKATELIGYLRQNIAKFDALVVSDYGDGVCSSMIIECINDICSKGENIVCVDSRHNLLDYSSATSLLPHIDELNESLRYIIGSEGELCHGRVTEDHLRLFMEKTGCKMVLLKKGCKGLALYDTENGLREIPVKELNSRIIDVAGAGDTVMAIFSLSLCSGADPYVGALLSAIAASVSVKKEGTTPVNIDELMEAIDLSDNLISISNEREG